MANDEWETPRYVITMAEELWGPVTLDVCATQANTKATSYITKEMDALRHGVDWTPPGNFNAWMNPPYSNLLKWTYKAWAESSKGNSIIGLMPVCTSTKWWIVNVIHCVREIAYFEHRIKFIGGKAGARFDSCLVLWKKCPRYTSRHNVPLIHSIDVPVEFRI